GIAVVACVCQDLLGCLACVHLHLVNQRHQVPHIRRLVGQVAREDDLALHVNDQLGIVALDEGLFRIAHDPRIGVGKVPLGLSLGFGWRVILVPAVCRLFDPLLLGLASCFLFQLSLGAADGLQSLLPVGQ